MAATQTIENKLKIYLQNPFYVSLPIFKQKSTILQTKSKYTVETLYDCGATTILITNTFINNNKMRTRTHDSQIKTQLANGTSDNQQLITCMFNIIIPRNIIPIKIQAVTTQLPI